MKSEVTALGSAGRAQLVVRVSSAKVAKNTRVADSVTVLESRRDELQQFETLDDLVAAAWNERAGESRAQVLCFHIAAIRRALGAELWSRQIFIGTRALDDLVFYAAKGSHRQTLLDRVINVVARRVMGRPGVIVFPLHSFGIIGAGLLLAGSSHIAHYVHPDWGIAVAAQSNRMDKTLAFLDAARLGLGVKQPMNGELLHHWHRSRAPWLIRNPLLAVRFIGRAGSYYDTEHFVRSKIEAATSVLAMVGIFQPEAADPTPGFFSSSSVNNWQTLDIHHYLVFYESPHGKELQGECVPMHAAQTRVVELSNLGVQINPGFVQRRRRIVDDIASSVEQTFAGYLGVVYGKKTGAVPTMLARMFRALTYFRRSLHDAGRSWSGTVSLATAYEMLLTDDYSGGVTARLERRLRHALAGVRGTRSYQAAFRELYNARSDLVHSGAVNTGMDLLEAQQGFVHAFCELAARAGNLHPRTKTPARDLTCE